ncbi:MAG: LuxR C-terminal-related transcriptional regulator [Gemmatimonadaceae bacterium]|nr:LuxR C-terminal-related transcriptional regulator [Gemmatimonadaceae bacterium]
MRVAAVLAASGTPRPPALHQTGDLTPREVDVLRLVATGRTNKEIATTLGISARTVGHHLAHCYARLGVSTRAGAALVAMERGLLAEAGEHRLPRPTTLSSPR